MAKTANCAVVSYKLSFQNSIANLVICVCLLKPKSE